MWLSRKMIHCSGHGSNFQRDGEDPASCEPHVALEEDLGCLLPLHRLEAARPPQKNTTALGRVQGKVWGAKEGARDRRPLCAKKYR